MKIEVATGEIVDKVSILQIKLEMVKDPAKLANVAREYSILIESMISMGISEDSPEFRELKAVNLKIGNIEDRIRELEALQEFGEEFIRCARGVYHENDRRAVVKRRINLQSGSSIVEEKEYTGYTRDTL